MFQDHRYPGVPDINLITIHRTSFRIGDTEIIPIRVYHYKLPILGFRIGDFAYLTDLTVLPESEKKKLSGVKVLVIEALRKTPHLAHMSLSEALTLSRELEAPQVILTHLSHQMRSEERRVGKEC